MKYIDINQKFTAKVAEYIAKGYTINTATMSGSQGEVAHVDLTDGKQVVRVLLDSFTEYDSFNSLSGLEIVVGTPADKVVPYDTARHNTIWNNRLEVIESERFYEIGSSKRRGNTFYGTTHAGRIKAYIQFCLAMSAWSINCDHDNLHFKSIAGYTQQQKHDLMMRVLTKRLGMRGPEFKTARLHLTAAFETALAVTAA